MPKSNIQPSYSEISSENNYVSSKKTKKFDMYKKIKFTRMFLFWGPVVHIAASIVFIILLLVGALVNKKIGFDFNKTQLALALSYIGIAVLVNVACFMVPAKKVKKKASFRITAISTLILSTLILAGSFPFWVIPTLLFYSLITLIIWILEVIAAVFLVFIVEELPNEK